MKDYSLYELQSQFSKLGHRWPQEIHLIGIRSKTPMNNVFSDVLYAFQGNNIIVKGIGTTIPGRYYLLKPMNPKGCAILKEGQYTHCWKYGLHNGYEALIQCAPIIVYRDANRDAIINQVPGTEDVGLFQVDIHHAAQGFIAKFIDQFSAGCQVWQNIEDYNKMLKACKESKQAYFTYSLINEF